MTINRVTNAPNEQLERLIDRELKSKGGAQIGYQWLNQKFGAPVVVYGTSRKVALETYLTSTFVKLTAAAKEVTSRFPLAKSLQHIRVTGTSMNQHIWFGASDGQTIGFRTQTVES